MRWTWDAEKNVRNLRRHKLGLKLASRVFDDPLHVTRPDPYEHEERWQTMGLVVDIVLFVVHTWLEPSWDDRDGEPVGRIILARKAEPHERRQYHHGQFDADE